MSRNLANLTVGLTEDEKDHFIKSYKAGQYAREHLVQYIQKLLDAELKEEEKVENLKWPNWQLRQASSLGHRRALRKFITLLDQDL